METRSSCILKKIKCSSRHYGRGKKSHKIFFSTSFTCLEALSQPLRPERGQKMVVPAINTCPTCGNSTCFLTSGT